MFLESLQESHYFSFDHYNELVSAFLHFTEKMRRNRSGSITEDEKQEWFVMKLHVNKEEIQKKTKINQSQKKKVDIVEKSEKLILDDNVDNRLSFDSLINSSNIQDLIKEDELISKESEENQIEMFSSQVIQSLQSAWRKPINIQDGLVCNLRLTINKNGRVLSANLIKSSGNIRFDNSALKAVQRVETFSFFNEIPLNIYSSNFKNIVITFNPS